MDIPPPIGKNGETCKSHARRWKEGWYERYAPDHLSGIDIGCAHDPLNHTFRRWDIIFGDGDAMIMEGVPDNQFHTVYASHILEHVLDPVIALRNWHRIVRPGGHLIVCVPHRDLYEKKKFLPSNWNSDHKTFWLPQMDEPPDTRGLYETIYKAIPHARLISLKVLDEGWASNGDAHSGGEYSIEAIIKK
jgi:ubiquinone/menaquinone biosynthesis C-methylase UbiE